MSFGKLLKQLRKERGLGQKEIHSKLGCTLQNLSNWEAGRYLPLDKKFTKVLRSLRKDFKFTRRQITDLIMEYQAGQEQALMKRTGLTKDEILKSHMEEIDSSRGGQVPLLNSRDFQASPLDITFRGKPWKGPRIKNLPGLSPISTFAFLVEDKSAAPMLLPGDVLFCDGLSSVVLTDPKDPRIISKRPGSIVVASVGEKVVCGILVGAGDRLMLNWGQFAKAKRRVVLKNQVQWVCSASARVTNLESVSISSSHLDFSSPSHPRQRI